MKNLFSKILFCIAACLMLCSYAFADVAAAPMYAIFLGIPAAIVAVLIILIAVIVYVIKRSKK